MTEERRELLVFAEKTFKIRVPMNAKITFAPFSPPSKNNGYDRNPGKAVGTLRIYDKTNDRIIGVFSGVSGFRDMALDYIEEVAREEGAIIWKSDNEGYTREEKVKRATDWVAPALPPATKEEEIPF